MCGFTHRFNESPTRAIRLLERFEVLLVLCTFQILIGRLVLQYDLQVVEEQHTYEAKTLYRFT